MIAAGVAALFLATGAAQAGSYLFLCKDQFFVVWTHSWPAAPSAKLRNTHTITHSDPDGEEWYSKDGEQVRASKRLIHFNGSDLFFRGRKCEYLPPEEKR
jgi:hypothetical protein